MDDRRHPIMGPDWDGYCYFYGEGLLARIQFDVQAAGETAHSPHSECIRVILFVHPTRTGADGQPDSDEEIKSLLYQQRLLVDSLSARSVRCRFVGSMLYGGMFDLVFQLEARQSEIFKAVEAEWAKTSGYRVEIKQSGGWGFFDTKVRPSAAHAQQIADRRVIQGLINAGSEPTKLHRLDHRIEGPPHILPRIARDLEANGFVDACFPADGALLIATESPLDLMKIWGTTRRLVEYCAKCGARYDGWGAAVVASEP